ncbi:MAG: acetamidase/formamidase [Natronomonas sp.]|jgi:acetamidase/formamidase
MSQQVQKDLEVDQFTLGLVGPEQEWAGTVADGGTVRTHTPPACWGPMITPEFRGGHEVTRPIRVDGAEPGDALVVHIKDVEVTSVATSTGSMAEREEAFGDDPFVDHVCPECGTEWPESVVEGTGEDAIRCAECGANASSFGFEFGYTVAFDEDRSVGLTVGPEGADDLANRAHEAMDLPENSRQHPILLYKPDEIPGTLGHLQPFIGNIGTTPSREFPDSHNAGDFGQFLIGADHDWGLENEEELDARTDGHLDSNDVRPGATLICPVEIEGAGLYVGDLHANQGDGELSLHTTDVSGKTELEVEVVKDVDLDGPLLLPNESDLPDIAKPYTDAEREAGAELADQYGVDDVRDAAPVQFIGSGATINEATDNAFERAGNLFGMSEGEVRSRCTFTGGVEIARLPGVVQLSMLAPIDVLEECNLAETVRGKYEL